MIKKTTISLQKDLYDEAEKKKDKFFGGNLSGYITHLISKDLEQDKKGENNGN